MNIIGNYFRNYISDCLEINSAYLNLSQNMAKHYTMMTKMGSSVLCLRKNTQGWGIPLSARLKLGNQNKRHSESIALTANSVYNNFNEISQEISSNKGTISCWS